MKNSREELENLLTLLKIEKQEEIAEYKRKVVETPLAERKKLGLSWYPVVITDTEIGLGENLIIEIERTISEAREHSFNQGKVVSLFNNTEQKENPSVQGVILSVYRGKMKIALYNDELPEWIDDGKLGVDLFYDETSYREMEFALRNVMKAEKNRLAELREIILGYKKAGFKRTDTINYEELNDSQNKAVALVEAADDIALIHGPPGTGKTTTMVKALAHILKDEKQVMAAAASNMAVDLLTDKLAAAGIKVIRLGHPARIKEKVLKHTLDSQIVAHKSYRELKHLRRDAVELKKSALKFKRKFGIHEREQRKEMLAEAKVLVQQARQLEKFIVDDLFEKAQVITCTLVGASGEMLRNRRFSTVFIDEAAQALEPAAWIAVQRADKVVFAGDHCQLPPTVKSIEAEKAGLNVTLFEKCMERHADASQLLNTQYRMNEKIMNFSNAEFYNNKLIADDSVKEQVLGTGEMLLNPVDFIDTAGCGFEEEINNETQSSYNPEEAKLVCNHLNLLLQAMENEGIEIIGTGFEVGIISPYKAQVLLIESLLKNYLYLEKYKHHISVDTVDGFQGQERDVICISLVRSNDIGEIGFLKDIRRMNVAMTRARKKLVIAGDSATLAYNAFYNNFLEYVGSIDSHKSAWEFME